MAVDYRPVMGEYTELKPFRFWCQKVLPLVYDDSLSYYELLCKVVDYLNKTMEDVETLHGDVENLSEAYNQLQSYVNDYFDNLDVQEEINNKLDSMAQDGSLSALIQPLIPDIVADWMDEHLTPTTPVIDDTLSVSGAGADAKKTGDAIGAQYNPANTYHIGDFVLHDGNVYMCNVEITTPEAWNSAHWLVTKVTPQIKDIKSSVSEMSKLNYIAEINRLNKVVAFHANQGDHIRIYTKDGTEFTADSKILFLGPAMNIIPEDKGLWWLGSGRSERGVTASVEYCFVYTFDGESQDIIVENTDSIYNFRDYDNKIVERMTDDENALLKYIDKQPYYNVDLSGVTFEFGGISVSGVDYSTYNSIRSGKINTINATKYFLNFVPNGDYGNWKIHKYGYNDSYIGNVAYESSGLKEGTFDNQNVKYIRLTVEYWGSVFSDLSASGWFKSLHLMYPVSGKFAIEKSVYGASFTNILNNIINYRKDFCYCAYQEGSNYSEAKVANITLAQNTQYTLICGNISENVNAPILRLYVVYADTTVDRNDVTPSSLYKTFTTKNKPIDHCSLYAIGVNDAVAQTDGICYYTDIALIEGIPNIKFAENPSQIPSYYEAQLRTKEETIRTNERNTYNGDSFVFLTDTHYTADYLVDGNNQSTVYNTNYSPSMINHIFNNTSVRMLLFGGDLINSSDDIDHMIHGINKFNTLFDYNKDRIAYCVGNHEYYTDLGQQVENRPTADWLFVSSMRYNENSLIASGPMSTYCFDNVKQKIRYFVIACGRDTETSVAQTEWVLSKLTEVPDDYHIVCVGHAFLLDNMSGFRGYYGNIMSALDAITAGESYTFNGNTYDYSNLNNVEVICAITGHTHIDGYLESTGGTLCICTTCDSWEQNYTLVNGSPVKSSRNPNTVDSQAFDVFQFDFTNKKIYCTRIGYGNNREFTYQ